ncbi:MAG: winged helix-turn-helix transcriptional regulator [Candidatus Bathyarchaeota archaeon]|nr:winged helix-turn-helix transcriptional regulator [Candidatus Bathyarchaeota archaeon]
MKLNKTLTAVFLILLIAFSFAAIIYRETNRASTVVATDKPFLAFSSQTANSYALLPTLTHNLLTAYSLNADIAECPAPVLSNATRAAIYNFVKANPGVQFRGICTQLCISIGLAEFHLGVLKKSGLISFFRDGRYKRFFESKKFSQKQMQLISLLRHDTTRNILKTLLNAKQASHSELSRLLAITSQGLTWQMNRLQKDGVIQESKDGVKTIYAIEHTYAPMLTELVNLVANA